MADTFADRRIGSRAPVRIPVTVQMPPEKKRALRRIVVRRIDGFITDLSVTGAEIECRQTEWLQARAHVLIGNDDGAGSVEIRRVEPIGNGQARYGVLFLELDTAFAAALHNMSTGGLGGQFDWRWDKAR